MTDRTKAFRLAALAATALALAACADLAGTHGRGEKASPRAAEAHQHIVTYNDVRITPSVVPGVHTYFGYSNSIVSKQRFRLMVYDYPELLQAGD